jgi:D-tyrosyl-tRNA(Tyr) deacylase
LRLVIQRVTGAELWADGVACGAIANGLVVFVGVARHDQVSDANRMAAKLIALRVFEDSEGKMNRSIQDCGGEILVVSNFTLYANTGKGNRPSFDEAARPEDAKPLYEHFVQQLRLSGLRLVTGVFQAHMRVLVDNDGPVTLLCES